MSLFSVNGHLRSTMLLILASSFAQAQGIVLKDLGGGSSPKAEVTAELIASQSVIAPGDTFDIAVRLNIPKGTYSYYKSPGTIGLGTKVSFLEPTIKGAGPATGFVVGEVEFPTPDVKYEKIGESVDVSHVYKKTTLILARVTAPKTLQAGEQIEFAAKVAFQYCEDGGGCFPPKPQTLKLTLKSGAKGEPAAEASAFSIARKQLPASASQAKYVKITPKLSATALSPNLKTELLVNVEVAEGHKLQMNRPTIAGFVSTDLIVDPPAGVRLASLPIYPEAQPPKKVLPGGEKALEYRDTFTIRVPLEVGNKIDAGDAKITGVLRYQACNDEGTCYPPMAVRFELAVPTKAIAEATLPVPESAPIVGSVSPPATQRSFDIESVKLREESEDKYSLPAYLAFAFLGGLILNIMPCVLPVLAIKVLSFIQQAGESKLRIFLLNVCYSAGVIAVFLVLATLAVSARIGWGGLFQRAEFNIFMACLVFAMGLSLLGVFEIPVPGFTNKLAGNAHREGLTGAFMTGILATLLATPCSGPFLGTTLGWSVRQPAAVTYLVWLMMGLGMSSPYLLIGLLPGAVKLLPKPGNWMIAFKELAGIVLMGTVVFIIWFLDELYTMPVLVFLIGIACSCWVLGRYPLAEPTPAREFGRLFLAAIPTVVLGAFSMMMIHPWVVERRESRIAMEREKWFQEYKVAAKSTKKVDETSRLNWQPFTESRLVEHLNAGRTVLVDFSADWCLTCKTNEATALNTQATKALVNELGVVTLYADYTHQDEEIKRWLTKLNSISVPLTAIFPAGDPNRPIIIRDLYTESQLGAKLREAGPSLAVPREASAAQSSTR